ncbi:MHYT domain-containing protein [Psychrobacter sp. APC 3426]|uniref:MHYT domain-containing protein n=1 Tax=Psychrobacter sp. APC 3426 TaxID=3035177 RepID=UPI0025B43549|nr:MHYT domain-containing protein [Psychrobacter sp. APC 3426]MDN3399349.1 MHYT domain-containing protein [Psychrobacter sp. APC 3426]
MIEVEYNLLLVLVSYAIAVFGSYVGLNLAIRVPSAKPGTDLYFWVALSSIAIGGAIWSMHYIGMMAVDMKMPVTYDLGLTIVSMLLAILFVAVGVVIVGRGPASIAKLIGGGVLTGLGVAAMHYTGMASMQMEGTMSYNTTLLIASIVIAIAASIAALWLAFNLRGNLQRFGSAFIMGIAVCGMHYTGMAAMEMHHTGEMMAMEYSHSGAFMSSIFIFIGSAVVLSLLWVIASKNAPQKATLVFGE